MEPTTATPCYAGHPVIDRDHDVILKYLERIASRSEVTEADIGGVIAQLWAYLDSHFENEEQLMVDLAYPSAAEHADEHVGMRVWLMDRLAVAGRGLSVHTLGNTAREVAEKLLSHMTGADERLAAFLHERSISPHVAPGTGVFDG